MFYDTVSGSTLFAYLLAMSQPHPELIFGSALVGLNYMTVASLHSLFNVLKSGNITSIDTAARYPPQHPGRSEELLGEAGAAAHGFAIDTKVLTLPTSDGSGDVEPAASRSSLDTSRKRLGLEKVRTLYVHRPDPQTPLVDQARGLDELYREGKVEHVGMSNLSAPGIEAFIKVCDDNGFVRPSVYQGNYSVIEREVEASLLPVLRKYGIRFVAYRAVAAGFLAGNLIRGDDGQVGGKEGTRFASGHPFADVMKSLYGSDKARTAFEQLKECLQERQEDCGDAVEAALRWICYHSALNDGDAVLLGASREEQIVKNIEAVRRGPLPEEVAAKMSQVWNATEGQV